MNLIPKRKYTGTPAVQESTIQETIGRIGSLEVESLSADQITAGNLAADVIATCNLNATQITAGDIATNRLTANAANAVNGGSILITAARINVNGDCTFASGYDPSGKTATFQSAKASIPTSITAGDTWFTTDGHETYRAVIAGANEIKVGEWVLVDQATAINNGTTTISGGKITTGTLSADAITTSSLTSKKITLAIAAGTGDVAIQAGKTDFTNTDSGFILGLDDSDSDLAKFYIGSSTVYLNWTGAALNIAGASITAGSVTIDADGINIDDATSTCALIFKDSATEKGGIFWSHTLTEIQLYTTAGDISLWPTSEINLKSTTAAGAIYPSIAASAGGTSGYALGTSSYEWRSIYAKNHVIDGGVAEAITGNLWYNPSPNAAIGVYTGSQFWYVMLPYYVGDGIGPLG